MSLRPQFARPHLVYSGLVGNQLEPVVYGQLPVALGADDPSCDLQCQSIRFQSQVATKYLPSIRHRDRCTRHRTFFPLSAVPLAMRSRTKWHANFFALPLQVAHENSASPPGNYAAVRNADERNLQCRIWAHHRTLARPIWPLAFPVSPPLRVPKRQRTYLTERFRIQVRLSLADRSEMQCDHCVCNRRRRHDASGK